MLSLFLVANTRVGRGGNVWTEHAKMDEVTHYDLLLDGKSVSMPVIYHYRTPCNSSLRKLVIPIFCTAVPKGIKRRDWIVHRYDTIQRHTLIRSSRDLVANLAIVFWQVDDQISLKNSSLAHGITSDDQVGCFSTSPIHTSSNRLHREWSVRVRCERGIVILIGHADGLDRKSNFSSWGETKLVHGQWPMVVQDINALKKHLETDFRHFWKAKHWLTTSASSNLEF